MSGNLGCSQLCSYWGRMDNSCNSYSLQGDPATPDMVPGEVCSLAVLTYLEEVVQGEEEQVGEEAGDGGAGDGGDWCG